MSKPAEMIVNGGTVNWILRAGPLSTVYVQQGPLSGGDDYALVSCWGYTGSWSYLDCVSENLRYSTQAHDRPRREDLDAILEVIDGFIRETRVVESL